MPHRSARPTIATLAAGALVLTGASAARAMTGGNLVVNGDAEAPLGREWTSAVGGALAPLDRRFYGVGDASPPLYLTGGTFDGGVAHLWGTGARTVATQVVALTPEDAEAIDTGTVRARLTADVGALQSQTDEMRVTARWTDDGGATVLTQDLAPATVAERGGLTGFLRRSTEAPVPPGARAVEVTLTGRRDVGVTQDGYVDNLVLRLVSIPEVRAGFAAKDAVPAGAATPLALRVENSGERGAKGPWRLRYVLPEGLRVASTVETTTTCPGGRVTGDGRTIEAAGAVPAGLQGCDVRVPVLADAPGAYRTDARDVVASDGLRVPSGAAGLTVRPRAAGDAGSTSPGGLPEAALPPAPEALTPPAVLAPPRPGDPVPAPPVADALLRVTVTSSRARVRPGRTVRLRTSVRNRSAVAATNVDVCLALPSGLTYVPRPATGRRIDGRRCWTARRIAPGATRAFALTARAGGRPGLRVVRGRAGAAEALGVATGDRSVRVLR